ncbi:MAG: hypothetical protein ABIA93_06280 [Candidatus Woesearchaeota archaeon]
MRDFGTKGAVLIVFLALIISAPGATAVWKTPFANEANTKYVNEPGITQGTLSGVSSFLFYAEGVAFNSLCNVYPLLSDRRVVAPCYPIEQGTKELRRASALGPGKSLTSGYISIHPPSGTFVYPTFIGPTRVVMDPNSKLLFYNNGDISMSPGINNGISAINYSVWFENTAPTEKWAYRLPDGTSAFVVSIAPYRGRIYGLVHDQVIDKFRVISLDGVTGTDLKQSPTVSYSEAMTDYYGKRLELIALGDYIYLFASSNPDVLYRINANTLAGFQTVNSASRGSDFHMIGEGKYLVLLDYVAQGTYSVFDTTQAIPTAPVRTFTLASPFLNERGIFSSHPIWPVLHNGILYAANNSDIVGINITNGQRTFKVTVNNAKILLGARNGLYIVYGSFTAGEPDGAIAYTYEGTQFWQSSITADPAKGPVQAVMDNMNLYVAIAKSDGTSPEMRASLVLGDGVPSAAWPTFNGPTSYSSSTPALTYLTLNKMIALPSSTRTRERETILSDEDYIVLALENTTTSRTDILTYDTRGNKLGSKEFEDVWSVQLDEVNHQLIVSQKEGSWNMMTISAYTYSGSNAVPENILWQSKATSNLVGYVGNSFAYEGAVYSAYSSGGSNDWYLLRKLNGTDGSIIWERIYHFTGVSPWYSPQSVYAASGDLLILRARGTTTALGSDYIFLVNVTNGDVVSTSQPIAYGGAWSTDNSNFITVTDVQPIRITKQQIIQPYALSTKTVSNCIWGAVQNVLSLLNDTTVIFTKGQCGNPEQYIQLFNATSLSDILTIKNYDTKKLILTPSTIYSENNGIAAYDYDGNKVATILPPAGKDNNFADIAASCGELFYAYTPTIAGTATPTGSPLLYLRDFASINKYCGPCRVLNARITPDCGTDGLCAQNEYINVTASITPACSLGGSVKINAESTDALCDFGSAPGSDMPAIQVSCSGRECKGQWQMPNIVSACTGKTVNAKTADYETSVLESQDNKARGAFNITGLIAPCTLTNTVVTPVPGCGRVDPEFLCQEGGDKLRITATLGPGCPLDSKIQVDADIDTTMDSGECKIRRDGPRSMTGMNITCAGGVCSGSWPIPEIPANCEGKNMNVTAAAAYRGNTWLTSDANPTGKWMFGGHMGTCNNDGILDPGEECDTNVFGNSCQDMGYDQGTPVCTAFCTVDYTSCTYCGDLTAQYPPETCDDTEFLFWTSCADLNPTYTGNLLCTPPNMTATTTTECQTLFNCTGPIIPGAYCGDSIANQANESCDNTDMRGMDSCDDFFTPGTMQGTVTCYLPGTILECTHNIQCYPIGDANVTIHIDTKAQTGVYVPMSRAEVRIHFSGVSEISQYTNIDGNVRFENIPSGPRQFSARKEGYDTISEARMLGGGENSFTMHLINASCHSDCTDYYGRCNPQCEGLNFTTSTGIEECKFYDERAKSACAYKLKGTNAIYNSTGDETYIVTCCEDAPIPTTTAITNATGTIDDVYKLKWLTNYQGRPVTINILVWD